MSVAMNPIVRLERTGDVLVVVIDHPPVNALSAHVRQGLISAMQTLREDVALTAAVLAGSGRNFVAGADLNEFSRPLGEPTLPQVITAIEECSKPVVAALHGFALGGGLELALGCDARVAVSGAVVGLPEVTLGLIPGAGGTQRLPRLVGIARAVSMICGGQRLTAAQALDTGLVDEIVAADELRAAAIGRARSLAGRKRLVRDLPVAAEDPIELRRAIDTALKAAKGRPAAHAAVQAITAVQELSVQKGLEVERALFLRLRESREARALRHQFFAERESAKSPASADTALRAVQHIAVIGAGTMGAGIAIAALDGGFDVLLMEQDPAALARGAARVRDHYASRVGAGKLDAAVARACQDRLRTSLDWTDLAGADLVIEAVFEELAVKQQVFQNIDRYARSGAVLATNTSYLDLDAIAGATRRAQDVIGLHFFSPAHVMRLVEVVRGKDSAPDVLATGMSVAKRLGKLPVVTGNAFGFIGNRLYAAYRRQCEFMVEEGAWPEQVDAALQSFGFAMGPFAVADLSGLDIAWRMRQAQAASRDPRMRYVDIPDQLCEAGRLGRKTGAGYYSYPENAKSPQVDETVHALIEASRARKGISTRAFTDEEIRRRALLALVSEAALLLADGVTQRAADVDVVLVNGYGFPRWEGGPVFWARERGGNALRDDLAWLSECSGPGIAIGDPCHLLEPEAAPLTAHNKE